MFILLFILIISLFTNSNITHKKSNLMINFNSKTVHESTKNDTRVNIYKDFKIQYIPIPNNNSNIYLTPLVYIY